MSYPDRHSHKYLMGLLVTVLLIFGVVLSACSGSPGSQGIQGPPGPLGPKGEPGAAAKQPGASIIVISTADGSKVKGVTIAGSGFAPNELVLLALIGKNQAAWGLGEGVKANESGTFIYECTSRQLGSFTKLFLPDTYVHTIKATGSEGSLATAPLRWPKPEE